MPYFQEISCHDNILNVKHENVKMVMNGENMNISTGFEFLGPYPNYVIIQ